MSVDQRQLAYTRSYLRRQLAEERSITLGGVTYPGTLAGFRDLADAVFTESASGVTITSASTDGGSTTGQVTMDPALLGQALEDILAESDASIAKAPRRQLGYIARYSTPDQG